MLRQMGDANKAWHTILPEGDMNLKQATLAGAPHPPCLLAPLLRNTHHHRHQTLSVKLLLFFCSCLAWATCTQVLFLSAYKTTGRYKDCTRCRLDLNAVNVWTAQNLQTDLGGAASR